LHQAARSVKVYACKSVQQVSTAFCVSGAGNRGGGTVSEEKQEQYARYWRANERLIVKLLVIWAFVSFGCSILLVELLNKITFFGVPFGFWMAQQGSIYVFVILIFYYAWRMDKFDVSHHVDE
jgi:putative solute:sodium symporter small subunit